MFANKEETNNAPEQSDTGKNNQNGHVSPELIKYKKNANLEFLNEQSLHLTQLFNQRIHGNLKKVTPTAGAQVDHPHKKFLPDIQASTIF